MDDTDKKCASRLYVNLKEHFEKLWIERKENITLQFGAVTDRLNATATVLDHRLEVLNHAHEQSIEDRADFMRESEFKSKMKEIDTWHTNITMRLTESETRSKTWSLVISIFFTLMQIFIGVMIYIKK